MVDEPVAKAAKRPGTKPKGPINKIVPMDPKNGVVQLVPWSEIEDNFKNAIPKDVLDKILADANFSIP